MERDVVLFAVPLPKTFVLLISILFRNVYFHDPYASCFLSSLSSIVVMADDHSPVDLEKDKQGTTLLPPGGEGRRDSSALGVLQLVNTRNDAHPIYWPVWRKWSIVTYTACSQSL